MLFESSHKKKKKKKKKNVAKLDPLWKNFVDLRMHTVNLVLVHTFQ